MIGDDEQQSTVVPSIYSIAEECFTYGMNSRYVSGILDLISSLCSGETEPINLIL